MNIAPHFLTAGNPKLTKNQTLIQRITRRALGRILARLHYSNQVDIVFSVDPIATIPEIGIGGFTPNAHAVYISLDPGHTKFISSLKTALPRTLAHELHHAVRWLDPGYGHTLGEALVTEGLAAHFEQEVFGGKPNQWDVAVTGKKLEVLRRRAKREFDSSTYAHADWFFGSERRRIPRWAGYALGYQLVLDYLRRYPHLRPSSLCSVKGSDLSG